MQRGYDITEGDSEAFLRNGHACYHKNSTLAQTRIAPRYRGGAYLINTISPQHCICRYD
jgi:hypothetical protein